MRKVFWRKLDKIALMRGLFAVRWSCFPKLSIIGLENLKFGEMVKMRIIQKCQNWKEQIVWCIKFTVFDLTLEIKASPQRKSETLWSACHISLFEFKISNCQQILLNNVLTYNAVLSVCGNTLSELNEAVKQIEGFISLKFKFNLHPSVKSSMDIDEISKINRFGNARFYQFLPLHQPLSSFN